MTRSNEKRGRGTVKPHFSYREEIKSREGKGKDLIGRYSETGLPPVPRPLSPSADRAALAAYLEANPGMTARDYKGKGFSTYQPFDSLYEGPNELPWDKLDRDEVRRIATGEKARFLPRNVRLAAARDPGLVWDGQSLAYRLRRAGPSPQRPTSGAKAGPGGAKSFGMLRSQTGDGHENNHKHSDRGGEHG